jgi:hypothetical protein
MIHNNEIHIIYFISHSAEQGLVQIPKEYRLAIYPRLDELCHLENPVLLLQ